MTALLLVSSSAKPGGAERALLGLVRQLPARGYAPTVALLEDGPLREWLAEAGHAPTVVAAGRTRHLHRTALAILRLRALARETGARAIVSNMSKTHVYGGLAALSAGLPAVWWQHEVPRGERVQRAAAAVPAAAVVCTSGAAADAQRRLTPRRRVLRIPPGLPLREIRAQRGTGAAIRAQAGWRDRTIVGIVGRLQPWKGQEVFLRAAALLAKTHPDVRFAVIGGAILGWEGDYPQHLRHVAGELGISDRVLFAGHQEEPWRWIDALDVVVHASAGEPFGLVIVEAMALGKPVVAAADAGPLEIVEDGHSGLLVPPGEPQRLAAALARVLDEDGLRERLGRAAAVRATFFSEERMADEFARLLDELAPGRQESGANGRRASA